MFRKLTAKGVGAVLVLFVLATAAAADVKLPGVFGDHMVLQRDAPVPVWGSADTAEKVTVTMGDQSKTVVADAAGKWSVRSTRSRPAGRWS